MNFYAYQHPLGKIDDSPELRDEFIAVFDAIKKKSAARFGLALGRHLLDITGYAPCYEITRGFAAVEEWLSDGTRYQKARSVGGELHDLAREESDPVKKRFFQTMAQIVCIPHVKFHALWASDFAVTLINRIHPGDFNAVKRERQIQIALLKKEQK